MPVFARNVVATSQPLASQAGLRMLRGGNAVDAALAAAIALTVVEPTSNGIGSDAFALLWDGQSLHGLNASGRAPQAWSLARFAGLSEMPLRGWDAVTVPGAVSAWVALSERFGKLPFEELFEPAIAYARDGFMVSPITAAAWHRAPQAYKDYPDFGATFLPNGRSPLAGETFLCPAQAHTLERIAQSRGEDFYRGELAQKIVAHAKVNGGAMTADDLSARRADWVVPIAIDSLGHTLHEIPPNGQGLAALLALGILERHDIGAHAVDSADALHLQIEAMKLAFADVEEHLGEESYMEVAVAHLLDANYLDERARLIDMKEAREPGHGVPSRGGTVYLSAADESGMMMSFIQSNYFGFGSGIVVPETGISLQNRGYGFSLREGHPNVVAGGKRPRHTIIPGFVTKDGAPQMSFGVMGGPMQPQGHAQMMTRLYDWNQNPQAACDAPRWRVEAGRTVRVEPGFAPAVLNELRERGHAVIEGDDGGFGGAQMIHKMQDGYCGASDPRKDGQAVGF